jgi:hypothetical protein
MSKDIWEEAREAKELFDAARKNYVDAQSDFIAAERRLNDVSRRFFKEVMDKPSHKTETVS